MQDGIDRLVASGKLLEAISTAAGLPDGIPETILRHRPLGGPRGAKVMVVTRLPLEMIGGIIIPQSARQQEVDGWILGVSHDVGAANSALGPFVYRAEETGWEVDDWDTVLGLQVTWGRFVGTVLKAREMDDPYEGRFLLMVEQDLLTVIGKVTV